MNLQVAKFQKCERALACPVVLVHASSIHYHLRAFSTKGCAFVYFSAVVQYLYFKPRRDPSITGSFFSEG